MGKRHAKYWELIIYIKALLNCMLKSNEVKILTSDSKKQEDILKKSYSKKRILKSKHFSE